MKLFHPSHFPVCHDGGVTRVPIGEFDEIQPGVFAKKSNGTQYRLYDAMKTSMQHSIDQVMFNYSSWTYFELTELTVGNIKRIEIPLPPGYDIYSVPLPTAMMGNVIEGEHCFPSLFTVDANSILIGTTAHQTENNPVGKTFGLAVTAYCYRSSDTPGWKKVLYSALSNLSQGNANISVLLLATAIELYSDYLFRKYLQQKGVEENIIENTVKSVRPWPLKAKRILIVLSAILPEFNIDEFNKSLNSYDSEVKKRRNQFAHEHSQDISKPEAHRAFCAVFDLLWNFDQLDVALEGV